MKAVVVLAIAGLVAGSSAASAAHCHYQRTPIIFGQDSQAQMIAPAGVPCQVFFRTNRERSEWSIAAAPKHGVLAAEESRGWIYTPSKGYGGPDVFTVEVTGESMGRYVYSGSSKTTFVVHVVP